MAGNDAVTNRLEVVDPTTNLLAVTLASPQRFNPQTGLMEQVLRLSNTNSFDVAGARVVFSGLTNRVFNAAGTNAGLPYVVLTRSLAGGERVDLLIEYFAPARTVFPDPVLTALVVPAFVPRAPAGSGVRIDRSIRLNTGGLLLEFAVEPGQAYHVIYSDDVLFGNALRALPAIMAPADRLQWIDEGPPRTSRRPDAVAGRFYRVIKAD